MPGKLRVAFSTKPPLAVAPPILDDACRAAVEDTAELLDSLGHDVARRDPDWGLVGNGVATLYLRGVADEARALPHPDRLGRQVRGVTRVGRLIPTAAVRRQRALISWRAARLNRFFEDCDVLLTPVIGEASMPVERWDGHGGIWTLLGMSRRTGFTGPWNYLGTPAAAVPCSFADSGLPLSVQLVGRSNDEATLLSLAAQLEAVSPWTDRRPPMS